MPLNLSEASVSIGRTACWVFFASTLLSLTSCKTEPSYDKVAWEASVDEWRTKRENRLREPDSWLTLVGLHWLEPGVNRFGSDPANEIVFPAEAPPLLGTIHYDSTSIDLYVEHETDMLVDGRSVRRATLRADLEDSTTIMSWASLEWYLIERDGAVGLRLKDSLATARLNFEGIDFYPIDPYWRVYAAFEPYDPPRTIAVPTILGTVSQSPSPGEVVFERDGVEYRLQAVADADDDEFFLIFADETNARDTYGGGRFLYTDLPDSTGAVVVDFNKAYSPPCVFSPYATCPLPPPENQLALAIEAGERMYSGEVVH